MDFLLPPGTIQAFGGSLARLPAGWLPCDGSVQTSNSYPRLFAAIGTAWGGGYANGVKLGDFNLPDLRGQFLRGVSSASTTDPDVSARIARQPDGNAGNEVGSYQADAFRSHRHTETRYIDEGLTANRATPSGDDVGSLETVNTGATGGSETRPINAYVNYIIKS
jgi:microcystin-dependent protein